MFEHLIAVWCIRVVAGCHDFAHLQVPTIFGLGEFAVLVRHNGRFVIMIITIIIINIIIIIIMRTSSEKVYKNIRVKNVATLN